MLYTLAVILLVLWLLGMVSGYAIGSFIHCSWSSPSSWCSSRRYRTASDVVLTCRFVLRFALLNPHPTPAAEAPSPPDQPRITRSQTGEPDGLTQFSGGCDEIPQLADTGVFVSELCLGS